MTQPTFNIFETLSAWSKTRPTGQHFLLSKLVGTLNNPTRSALLGTWRFLSSNRVLLP